LPEQVMTQMLDTVDPLGGAKRIGEYTGLSAWKDRLIGSVSNNGRFSFRSPLAQEGPMAELARPRRRGTIVLEDRGSTVYYRLSTRAPWVLSLVAGAIGFAALITSAVLAATGTVYGTSHHSLATPFLWVGLASLGIRLFVFLNTTPNVFRQGSYLAAWLSSILSECS
jgi:hypothetical protein